MRSLALTTVAILALSTAGSPGTLDGDAIRAGGRALASLGDRKPGSESARTALEGLAAAFREIGLEVWLVGDPSAPTAALARIRGSDERLRSETILVTAAAGGDPEACAALPLLARALLPCEPRRTVVLAATTTGLQPIYARWSRRSPSSPILVTVEVEALDEVAGRPAVTCVSTLGLHRTLLGARREPDVFLRLELTASDTDPLGPPERVAVRPTAKPDHPTTGPGTPSSLGRVGDLVFEAVKVLAAGDEQPPLGLAAVKGEASAGSLLARAKRLAAERRFPEALGLASRALHEEPEAVEARLFRAEILLGLDRPGAALVEAGAALRTSAKNPDALLLRGRAEEALGNVKPALSDYSAALAERTAFAAARARRGLLLVRLRRVDEGLDDLVAALRLDPDDPVALKGMGIARFHRRETAVAMTALDRAIRRDRDDWETWFYRGIVRLWPYPTETQAPPDPEDLRASLVDLTSAITADPRQSLPFEWRAELYFRQGAHERARADLDRAISVRPATADLHLRRGRVRHELQRFDAAIEDFEHALRLRPGDGEACFRMARSHARAGRVEEAVASLERAMAAGYFDDGRSFTTILNETDLRSLRNDPAFRRLMRGNRAD